MPEYPVPQVGVVGFGYIGTVIGTALADAGCRVTALDTDAARLDRLDRGETDVREPGLAARLASAVRSGNLAAAADATVLADQDVVVVTVGTPLGEDMSPDLDAVRDAIAAVGRHLTANTTVVLKSTVTPRTTDAVVAPLLERESGLTRDRDFVLGFCPERIAEGNALAEIARLPIVVGANTAAARERIAAFWQRHLGVETVEVASATEAELVKLADNVWIDVNIALANQISKLTREYGAGFERVRRAANTLPKGQHQVNILASSIGVGGSCLTKDPVFVADILETAGQDAAVVRQARAVNDAMPAYTAGLIRGWLRRNREAVAPVVAVFGLTFKNDTNDLRQTPVAPFVRAVEGFAAEVRLHDPLVGPEAAHRVFGDHPVVADAYAAAEGADVLCFACGHAPLKALDLDRLAANVRAPCLFVDGRRCFEPARVEAAGFSYTDV